MACVIIDTLLRETSKGMYLARLEFKWSQIKELFE